MLQECRSSRYKCSRCCLLCHCFAVLHSILAEVEFAHLRLIAEMLCATCYMTISLSVQNAHMSAILLQEQLHGLQGQLSERDVEIEQLQEQLVSSQKTSDTI